MSHIIQAGAVQGLYAALSMGTYALEHLGMKDILDLHLSSANVSPLTKYPTPFFIRRDRKDKQKKINIFGANGVHLYTIERLSPLNPVWSMLQYPSRKEVATINAGFFTSSVDFHNKPSISHREITTDVGLNGRYRSFYINDGAKYSWSGGSKFLEKVINPNGGVEEVRERVAKTKLMRQFKFDFEVLVDEDKIDSEVALATAFVSMLTQWGVGEMTNTVGPTYIEPRPKEIEDAQDESKDDAKVVVVIQNNDNPNVEIEQLSQ